MLRSRDAPPRASNIELLRVVAMLMIIVFHICHHAVALQLMADGSPYNFPVFYKRLIPIDAILTFGQIGNAIFVLITGYFMAGKPPKELAVKTEQRKLPIPAFNVGKAATKVVSMALFAAVFLVVGSTVRHFQNPEEFQYGVNIDIFNYQWWYIGFYLCLILTGAFFLNRFLAKLTRNSYVAFLIIIFAFFSLKWTGEILDGLTAGVASFNTGLRIYLVGIFLYSLGGYIRKYNPFAKLRWWVPLLVITLAYVIFGISFYNTTVTNIALYVEASGPFRQALYTPALFNPVPIVVAISLFELFRRLRLPSLRIINFLGASTFMIYLVHDHPYMRQLFGEEEWADLFFNLKSSPEFIHLYLKWTLTLFATGVVVYCFYLIFIKVAKLSRRLFIKAT